MSLDDIARVLIAFAIVDWGATVLLIWNAHHIGEPALSERASTSVILSTVATIGAALGVTVLADLTLPGDVSLALLAAGFALVTLPQVIWLVMLIAGRFR